MKVFWALALFAVAVSALPIEESDDGHISGENGWYVPQSDGTLQWMDMDEAESMLADLEMAEGRALTTTPVNFYLYTKSNPTTPQEIKSTTKSVDASHFNAKNPTRVVIHGWTQSYKDSMNSEIRDAWFTKGDFNIIIVDWGRARSVDYASSVLAVPKTGEKVGNMLVFLNTKYAMSLDTLEVIGHSLGAHVAGYAAKTVGEGKIHTVVGLDPALPLFSYDKPAKRLNSEDGHYVESIQTNGGKLGFLKPIGKGAFYPNGGQSQPGCGIDLTGACSHGRSVTYYAEAVRDDNFPSMKCETYELAVKKNCGSSYSSVRMGAMTNAYMVGGDFYVPVKSKAPFGMAAA